SGGKTTDGPFRVADSEPQFAVWPSPGGANDNKASFWELSCRTMPGNDSAIVCAEQFRMRNPENFDAESRACAAVGYSMVEVYVKLKMTTLLVAALALGTASAARAADLAVDTLHGRYSIADAGQDVDNAEMHLRVLLNRPARGIFAPADVACESRVRSAVSLVGIEGRHPGLLRGEA